MMEKNSAERKPCTFCGNEAVEGTYPPVCQEHMMPKQAAENTEESSDSGPKTLKELNVR